MPSRAGRHGLRALSLLARINAYLMRWLRKKHKWLRGLKKTHEAWARAAAQRRELFAHWQWVTWVPPVW